MLRKDSVSFQEFSLKFKDLMERGRHIEKTRLESEYLRETERYIEELYRRIEDMTPDEAEFDAFKEQESMRLNRLQKMKNMAAYRKEKHKKRTFSDGWE